VGIGAEGGDFLRFEEDELFVFVLFPPGEEKAALSDARRRPWQRCA
jgi:hypothetical protein